MEYKNGVTRLLKTETVINKTYAPSLRQSAVPHSPDFAHFCNAITSPIYGKTGMAPPEPRLHQKSRSVYCPRQIAIEYFGRVVTY